MRCIPRDLRDQQRSKQGDRDGHPTTAPSCPYSHPSVHSPLEHSKETLSARTVHPHPLLPAESLGGVRPP